MNSFANCSVIISSRALSSSSVILNSVEKCRGPSPIMSMVVSMSPRCSNIDPCGRFSKISNRPRYSAGMPSSQWSGDFEKAATVTVARRAVKERVNVSMCTNVITCSRGSSQNLVNSGQVVIARKYDDGGRLFLLLTGVSSVSFSGPAASSCD